MCNGEILIMGLSSIQKVVDKPTVFVVIHAPIKKNGSNGWGTALYGSYYDLVESGEVDRVIVLSAPQDQANIPDRDTNVIYRQVDCDRSTFTNSKAPATDVYIWDLVHLMRERDTSPLVSNAFKNAPAKYYEAWKNFFLYSIATATTALEEGAKVNNPIFHLNDPHDCFVSALFEGNYDPEFISQIIGAENRDELMRFETIKSVFLEKNKSIKHSRFWHIPAIDIESFDEWFVQDPKMAAHLFSSVFSSPLNVHSLIWKKPFDKLFKKYVDLVKDIIPSANRSSLDKGVGVGPIAYDPGSFIKRFEEYDQSGELRETLPILEEWSNQIVQSVGSDSDGKKLEPFVVFLTCRGDDPKANLIDTVKSIIASVQNDPEMAKRLVLVAAFNSSRVFEDELYQRTLDGFKLEIAKLAKLIGTDRIICAESLPAIEKGIATDNLDQAVELSAQQHRDALIDLVGQDVAECFTLLPNRGSNMPHQTAGFILANAFICASRGGFDVVALEASIVGKLKQQGTLAKEYLKVLDDHNMRHDVFRLIIANTAGSASYLKKIMPDNCTLINSDDDRMPTAERIYFALLEAYDLTILGDSVLKPETDVIGALGEVCGSDCVTQWTDNAVNGYPQDHPRTFESYLRANQQVPAVRL